MTWTVNQTELYGGVNRVPRINPYLPARTEYVGTTSVHASSIDIGKAVKLSGDTVVVPTSGDEILGFIESVEAATYNGYSVAGVVYDVGHEALVKDEVGDLAVGDLVVAGTAVALGTSHGTVGYNVKKRLAASPSQSALLQSGALAIGTTSKKAVKNGSTVIALVNGALVTKTTAETALSGTVTNAMFNVYALFVAADGSLSVVMGTEAATLAGVVIPQSTTARTLVGYVIVQPTTGNFVGGSTDLDDGTVVPRAVYVNTLGTVSSAASVHKWQVMAVYGSGAGRQALVRKV
jgi:hypothetical protein